MLATSQTNTPRRVRRSAFTLVEVMIATAVGGVVFITLYTGLAQGFAYVQRAHNRLRATQILTEKLEVVRLNSWEQVTTPGFIPSTFTEYYRPMTNGNFGTVFAGTLVVTNAGVSAAYNATMRRVIAETTWVSNRTTNRQRMETLISEYGIQNYTY